MSRGGAFMPSASSDGRILFSLFDKSCYNIAIIDIKEAVPKQMVGYETDFFGTDIVSELILGEKMPSHSYQEKMSSMSIIPKLMIDYNTVKPGFYFFSTEVIDRFSVFGGASANRLWDMDIFLMLEYMKYKPTYYANLFWISRHRDAEVSLPFIRVNGTRANNIETFIDLSFSLFSADIGTRIALGPHKFRFQYNYSNYRENVIMNIYQYVESLEGNYTNEQHGEFSFDYFRGHSIALMYELKIRQREYVMNMLPGSGWGINGNISYEWNNFIDGFSVSEEFGTIGGNLVPNNTLRITGQVEKHLTLNRKKKIVASISASAGGILNPEVNDYFHFFGGGIPGMKGYTFYDSTLTGPYYFIGTTAVRFPLFLEKNYIISQFNLQNLSIGGIFQFGGAVNERFVEFTDNYKLSAGFECRLKGFSFYSYPTAIAYEYHHPINDSNEKGKHYFTILFDY